MSLLDARTHELRLYPTKVEEDSLGNEGHRVADFEADPEIVFGALQPVQSTESNRDGQQVRSQYRFITRTFPEGAFAVAEHDELGRLDVVGEPLRRSMSPATRHVTVILQAQNAREVN